jgi:hypothetical protein
MNFWNHFKPQTYSKILWRLTVALTAQVSSLLAFSVLKKKKKKKKKIFAPKKLTDGPTILKANPQLISWPT